MRYENASMTELIGKTILGRYRVDDFLGAGGMAQVYRAWDRTRAVWVALKLLNADLADDFVFMRRFAEEAQTLERLKHPHVVRFLGFEEARGLAFMVMEYIQGRTLRRYMRLLGRPFRPAEMLRVLQPVCSALHYAHQMGIFHCDVKPANVFLETSGRVVLGDFGIARLSESATVTFSTPGTPAYMSPEQCRGGVALDGRTDVYALGITAYEMLTLDRPFKGDTTKSTGSRIDRVRWEQLNAPPPPLRRLNPSISPEIERVVLHALQKDRNRRFQGALAFYRAFAQAAGRDSAGREPVAILPDVSERAAQAPQEEGSAYDAVVEEARPSRKPLMVMGSVAVLLVAVLFFLLRSPGSPPDATPPPTSGSGGVAVSEERNPTDLPPTEASAATAAPTEVPATDVPPPTATPTAEPSDVYVLYVIDSSNSMQPRIGDARLGLAQHLERVDPSINTGLVAYGHRVHALEDGSCSPQNVETMFTLQAGSPPRLIAGLNELEAVGKAPLEEAMRAAYQAFTVYGERRNAVILITDGGDTCGGEPLRPVVRNEEVGQHLPIYVAGIGVEEAEREGLTAMADGTGGRFAEASSAASLRGVLDEFVATIAGAAAQEP